MARFSAALKVLLPCAKNWQLAPPEWYERYAKRVENYALPKLEAARQALARVIAADGERLLAAVDAAAELPFLAQAPAVLTLRRVWAEQYIGAPGGLCWREIEDIPSPAGLITSPYDTEARYSTKRDVKWVGYKVHLRETCDEKTPHLIVNVETPTATHANTPAPDAAAPPAQSAAQSTPQPPRALPPSALHLLGSSPVPPHTEVTAKLRL